MRLYHGTSFAAAEKIMTEGLRTRGKTTGNWSDTIEGNENAVYLTSAYPIYHAIAAAGDEGMCAVIEVDVDYLPSGKHSLVPDEDVLEQIDRGMGQHTVDEMISKTKIHRDKLGVHRGTDNWILSVNAMGTCAHMGEIPISCITRIFWIDITEAPQTGIDAINAVTTIQAFQLVGHRHWALMAASLLGMSNEEIVESLKTVYEEKPAAAMMPLDMDLLDVYREEAKEAVTTTEFVQ